MSYNVDQQTKSSRKAVHFLRRGEPIVSRAFAATQPSYEVACGYPLDAVAFKERTTVSVEQVSCKACRAAIEGRPE